MRRGRKRKSAGQVPVSAPTVEAGAVIVDNEGTPTSSLEPGCAVVSLRRFPAVLKERIGILQARRKVAGVKDETLEMLHAYIAQLGWSSWKRSWTSSRRRGGTSGKVTRSEFIGQVKTF